MLIMIHASRHENQRALVETHQNGFHQFNFKLIPPARSIGTYGDRASPPKGRASPYVTHFYLCFGVWLIIFLFEKFAKPNKSKSTGVKKH